MSMSGEMALVALLVSMAVFGALGWAIGNSKGRGALGFVLGAFLGVVGLVIIALMGASDFPAYQARGPARPGRLAGPRRPLGPRRSGPRPRLRR